MNSIGKKISSIIFLSIMAITILIMLSLSFFGKINQIGDISKSAYQYEVLCETAKYKFEKYKSTGDSGHLDQLNAIFKILSMKDGTISEMYRNIENGMSLSEAVVAHKKKFGEQIGQKSTASLIKTLSGKPLLVQLVEITGTAHALTTDWQILVGKYVSTVDEKQKQLIGGKIISIEKKLPGLLKKFHGVMTDVSDYLNRMIKKMFFIISAGIILTIGIIAFFITRSITLPLKLTVAHVQSISGGNFKNTLSIKNKDELGIMVQSMNMMSQTLGKMVKEIKQGIDTLNRSSSEVSSFSDNVSSSASENVEKSTLVAAAAEEMSSNMNSVSTAMEDSSSSTSSVVAMVEEMTVTINEISKNTVTAKSIADEAVEKSDAAAIQMKELDRMSGAIGRVTDTIREISEQTDLLSLNATIEAARAGEAGKGFAVVANEIKELSKQTSDATQDIQEQIDEIQTTATATVTVIEEISKVTVDVNQIIQTIASAIEEQSIATREIARNTSGVFEGITQVNDRVQESSTVARQITESIQEIHQTSDKMSTNSLQMKKSALRLTELAKTLGSYMDPFRV